MAPRLQPRRHLALQSGKSAPTPTRHTYTVLSVAAPLPLRNCPLPTIPLQHHPIVPNTPVLHPPEVRYGIGGEGFARRRQKFTNARVMLRGANSTAYGTCGLG